MPENDGAYHRQKQGWELGLFVAKFSQFGCFQKWFGRKFFIWPFVNSYENLTNFWHDLHVAQHSRISTFKINPCALSQAPLTC